MKFKLKDFVNFNPRRNLKKGKIAPYIDMASLQGYKRDVSNIVQKEFKGGGSRFTTGDTLLARITPCLENGKSALVNGIECNGWGSTEFIVMSPKDSSDTDFVYYITRFPKFREYAIRNLSGTSGRQRVSWETIADFNFKFPDKPYRKQAGKLLRHFDDLIQKNIMINKNLENIAQTFFKSWFVNFDPVHAKKNALKASLTKAQAERAAMAIISGICSPIEFSENFKEMDEKLSQKLSGMSKEKQDELAYTASLFPSEFEDSELGEVPRKWVVSHLGDHIDILDSKRIPLSKQQREKRAGNIPYYGATSCMGHVDDFIFNEELVLMGEDGSVIDENGFPFMQYVWGKSWVNNHAHVLKGREYFNNPHLYFLLKQTNITPFVTGAVQLKINQGNLKSIKFVRATTEISRIFNKMTESFIKTIINNIDQNRILESSRNTLLPKLLAGEIDLSGVKID